MASQKIKGITVEIDGDLTPLNNALKNADKTIKTTQGELKEVERLLKLDPENTEILTQKQKLLNTAVEGTAEKLNILKKAKEQAEKSGNIDKESYEYRYLQREIARTEQSLKSFEKQMDKTEDVAEDVKDSLEDAGESAENFSQGFSIAKGAAADFISNAAQKVISVVKDMVENTREYREDMNKLNTAFQTSEHTTEAAKEVYKDFYNVLGESDRSVEAVNHLARFVKTEEDLAKWGNIAAGVTATFGDSLPIEGLTEAANETAKVGTVTGVLADALNWVGILEDDFNASLAACSSEQERSKLITDTLNVAYMESAEAYKSMNADIIQSREATTELNDAMSRIGEVLEPLVSGGMSLFAGALTNIVDAVIPAKTETELLAESVESLAQKQAESRAKIEENMIQQLAQVESSRMLFEELQSLADETGRVNEADLTRAEFIIGELNSALGLEIQMNNGVVSSLDEIKGKIDEIIQKKQAQILLYAQEEKYTEAVKNMAAAADEQRNAYNKLAAAQDELRDLKEKAAAAERGEYLEWTSDMAERLNNLQYYYIEEYQKAYDSASNTVAVYSADMKVYEEAASAAVEGNTEKVIELLYGQGEAFKSAADVANLSAEGQKKAMGQQLIEAINAVEIAEANLKKVNSSDNKRRLEEAKEHAIACFYSYTQVGGQMVNGIIEGLNGQKRLLKNAMVNLLKETERAAKTETKINSPSKKYRDEIGAMIAQGVAVGIRENAKSATEAFKNMLQQLDAQKDVELISEEEYYVKLEELRNKYLEKGTKEWLDYTQKLYDYREKQNEKEVEQEKKKLDDIKKEMESAYDKYIESFADKYEGVLKEREKFSEKLKDFGNLYDTDAVIGYDYIWSDDKRTLTVKEKKGPKLSDLKEQTSKIRTYADNLKQLKGRTDIPPAFMESIRDMSIEQGIEFTTLLLSSSDTDLSDYIESWKEKQAAAASVAESVYESDIEQIRDSITQEMETLPDSLEEIARQAGQAFTSELQETIEKAMAEATPKINESILKAFPNIQEGELYFPSAGTQPQSTEIQRKSTSAVVNNYNYGVSPETAFTVSENARKVLNNIISMGELMT